MTYKNIRIPKRGGGTRLQRVKVLPSGKYKFVKNLTRKSSTSQKSRSSRRRSNPGRRKSSRRSGRNMGRRGMKTIPLAPVAGLLAGIAEPIQVAMSGDYLTAVSILSRNYTGFRVDSHRFEPQYLSHGLLPLILGGLIHKFVGGAPLNLNRMLGAAGVPLIRI